MRTSKPLSSGLQRGGELSKPARRPGCLRAGRMRLAYWLRPLLRGWTAMLSEVAAPFEEHFDHALADARVDLEADIAVGHRVVVAFDAHMAVRRDLAVDPLAPLSAARGRGWRTARSFASNTARRVSPHAIRAWLSRSSSRRMAAFIASSEKKVWWRSASRMRDWTAPTQASTSPLSAACPQRARSTATRAGCGIGRRLSAHVPDPVDSSGSIVRDHKRAVGCLQDVGRPSPPSPISVSGNGVQAPSHCSCR